MSDRESKRITDKTGSSNMNGVNKRDFATDRRSALVGRLA